MFRFGVIGSPITHTKSPQIHRAFAKQFCLPLLYEPIHAPKNEFQKTLLKFQQSGGCGLNVTAPFKELAFYLADEKSDAAFRAKSANTLSFLPNGKIIADNTDGIGFITDLTETYQISLKEKRILIVGAGGAARGILHHIIARQPSALVITNRTLEKAERLAKHTSREKACSIHNLHDEKSFDVIINTLIRDIVVSLPPTLCHEKTVAYDVNYDRKTTPFLQQMTSLNALQRIDGKGMLIQQAAFSFACWTGVMPDTESVFDSLE